MSLLEAFRNHLATLQLRPGSALVGVSGGPDSLVLLDLLAKTQDVHGQTLAVAHVDHGIHRESRLVAQRVEALAARYGLPFHTARLNLGPEAGETDARAQRYGWLESLAGKLGANVIFTGHHADDQAETVLMRVLAGSGPAGLAGMAATRGRLVRPLLPFTQESVLQHLEETGLAAWTDPANSDPRHLRSWIRTDLLPAIRRRNPGDR